MGDQLLPLPLTERSVHLCVDMQRIFSAEGPWPWMDRVLPVAAALASRHPERTVFTRFVPPECPGEMPGMWQRYYTRWPVATRERLDLQLLDLMPRWRRFAHQRPLSTRHAIPPSPSPG
jgi:nicotinamidase-related amidase